MSDFFNINSSFDVDSAISQVLFGERRPVMETELNEIQEIQDHLRRETIRTLFSQGLIAPFNLSYTDGTFRIWDTKALVDGEVIYISELTRALANGNSVYLEVWREELSYTHTIKKYGNEQETETIENKMIDTRMGFETSRRMQTKYQLAISNTAVEGHSFFLLGNVADGQFVQNPNIQTKVLSMGLSSKVSRQDFTEELDTEFGKVVRHVEEGPVSVKDYGAVGDGETDDTLAIQHVLDNYANIYFPEGKYIITDTLHFDGEQYDHYAPNMATRYVNKRIEFAPKAKLFITKDVDGFILTGSGTTIEGMSIDASFIGASFTKSAFILEGKNSYSSCCESNVINNLKITQEWGIKKGTALRLITRDESYVYKNKITNLEIEHFYYGIYFENHSYNGINANMFTGSIWASQQSMNIDGGGNIFIFNTQNTQADPDNPEQANVWCDGDHNQFIGLIYDVGNEGLVKYAYEFGEHGFNNTVTCFYPISKIKNPFNNVNFLQKEDFNFAEEQLVMDSLPNTTPFQDYRYEGGTPIPSKKVNMISGLNNALGRKEIIESIDVVANNISFDSIDLVANPMELTRIFNPNKLHSGWGNSLQVDVLNKAEQARLEIKINFKQGTDDMFMIKQFGLMFGVNSEPFSVGNQSSFSVIANTKDGEVIPFKRFGVETPETYHQNYQVMFVDPYTVSYYQNPVISLTLIIDIPPNTFTRNIPITYMYANAISLYGNSGSFAYIGGDKFSGDIEFEGDAGLVVKTPSGSNYKLEVDEDGSISWKNRDNGEIKKPSTLTVKDFGAVGDGVTDDATAINNAISIISSQGGGILRFDESTYLISSPIIMKNNVVLMGVPNRTTIVTSRSDMDAIRFQELTHNTEINGFILRSSQGINVDFQNGGFFYGPFETINSTIRNVSIQNFCLGIDVRTFWKMSLVENVHIKNCRKSIGVEQASSGDVSSVTFINLFSENPIYRHVDLEYVEGFAFIGCRLQGDGTQADSVSIIGGYVSFLNCRFDGMDSTVADYAMMYAEGNAILNFDNCYMIDYNSTATNTAIFEASAGARINVNSFGFEDSTGFAYLFRAYGNGRITYSNLSKPENAPPVNSIATDGILIDIDDVLENGVGGGGGGDFGGRFEFRYNPATNSLDLVVLD